MKKEKLDEVNKQVVTNSEELIKYVLKSMSNVLSDLYDKEKRNFILNKLIIKSIKKANIKSFEDLNMRLIIKSFFNTNDKNWNEDYRTQNAKDKDKILDLINSFLDGVILDVEKIEFDLNEKEKNETVKEFLVFSSLMVSNYSEFFPETGFYDYKISTPKESKELLLSKYATTEKKVKPLLLILKKVKSLIYKEKIIHISEIAEFIENMRRELLGFDRMSDALSKENRRCKADYITNEENDKSSLKAICEIFRKDFEVKNEKQSLDKAKGFLIDEFKDIYNNIVKRDLLNKDFAIDIKSLKKFDTNFVMDNDVVISKMNNIENERELIKDIVMINSLSIDFSYIRKNSNELYIFSDFKNEELKEIKLINYKEKIIKDENISLYFEISEGALKFLVYKSVENYQDRYYFLNEFSKKLNVISESKNVLNEAGIQINFYKNSEVYKSSQLKFLGQDTVVIEVVCKENELDMYEKIITDFIYSKIEKLVESFTNSKVRFSSRIRGLKQVNLNGSTQSNSEDDSVIDVDIKDILNNARKIELEKFLDEKDKISSKKKKKI